MTPKSKKTKTTTSPALKAALNQKFNNNNFKTRSTLKTADAPRVLKEATSIKVQLILINQMKKWLLSCPNPN